MMTILFLFLQENVGNLWDLTDQVLNLSSGTCKFFFTTIGQEPVSVLSINYIFNVSVIHIRQILWFLV